MTEGKAGFHNCEHTWQSGLTNGKLESQKTPAAQPPKQPWENITNRRGSKTRLLRRTHVPEDAGSNPNTTIKAHSKEVACPECGSKRLYKDGLRYLADGSGIQRWLCRDCGFRFSESTADSKVKFNIAGQLFEKPYPRKDFFQTNVFQSDFSIHPAAKDPSFKRRENVGSHRSSGVTIAEKLLNTFGDYNSDCRVCASESEAKNLAEVETTRLSQAAGATQPDPETTRGLLTKYAYWLEKENYKSTGYLERIRQLAKKGANLLDPEDVKSMIAQQTWKDGTKLLAVYAYDAMTKMLGIQWTPPKYKQEDILPFIPEEAELDQLIAASQSRRLRTFLQTLKETFVDPGEALRIEWIDVNTSNNTIAINHPVKGHDTGQYQVSNKLMAMLNALPKTSKRVFPIRYDSLHSGYLQFRKRVAFKLQNPRLLNISFNTFRHWGGTMTYYYTRKILYVQKVLRHKRIESTMKYTKLIQFKDDEFDVEAATTPEEATELLKAGFEKADEYNGIHLYRRPKRFGPNMSTAILTG